MLLLGPPNIEKLQAKGNVKGLIKALSYQKDTSVREKSAKALGEIGNKQAVESLIAALKDSDIDVQQAVAGALGQIGDARAVEPLIVALKDSDVDVHQAAAGALGEIGDAQAVESLITALKDSEIDGQQAVANALAHIVYSKKDVRLKHHAALALAQIHDRRAVWFLVDFISSRPGSARKFREGALEEQALVDIGSPAVDLLIGCLKPNLQTMRDKSVNRSSEKNMVAVEALARLGDSRAVEPLAGYLSSYPQERDRSKAAWALGEINDPAARESLTEALKDRGHSVRFEAAEALSKLGLIPEEVEDKVRYYIAREDVNACAELGKPATDTLITMLGYYNKPDFPFVARTLGKIGDPTAVKSLLVALEVIEEDSNPREFDGIVDSLVDIGEPAVDELIAALKRIDDPYDYEKNRVANGAACALVRMGETQAIEPLISILHYGGSASYFAYKRLAEFGSQAVEALLIALSDRPSSNMTYGIANALGSIEDKKAIHPLIMALSYQSDVVRDQAARALKKLTGEDYGSDYVRWEEWWDRPH